MKKIRLISSFLSFLLVLQILLPGFNVFAAELSGPTNVQISVNNGNDIIIRWKEVALAEKYNIYQLIDGERKLMGSTTRIALGFTNMPEGNYEFIVTAFNKVSGESISSETQELKLFHPKVAAPEGTKIFVRNGNDIILTWDDVQYANKYNVYQIKDGLKTLLITTDKTSRGFINLAEGSYKYEVTAVSDRFGESAGSVVEQSLTHPIMGTTDELKLFIRNGNDLILLWNEVEFASEYNVYQIIDGKRKLLTVTDKTSRGFINVPEGSYEYEVTAVSDRFGESEGVKVSETLMHPVMEMPDGLNLFIRNGNDLILTWEEVEFATGYNVYQINSGVKELLVTTDKTSRGFINLPEGKHEYEITAVSDRFGESAASKASEYLIYPDMTSPENLNLLIRNGNDIILTWNEVEYATGYNIYRIKSGIKEFVTTTTKTSQAFIKMPEDWYEYEVTAISDRFGESAGANAQLTLGHPIVESPVLQIKITEDEKATLSWNEIAGASLYEIYEIINEEYILIGSADKPVYLVNELTEGKHEYVVTVTHSRFGKSNYSNAVTAEVQTDVVAPVTESNVINKWQKEDFTVNLLPTDDKSGVNQTFYSINNTEFVEGTSFKVNQEGVNTVSFYSTDVAGNVEEAKTAEVKIDRTAPETVSNADGEWHTEFALEFTSTDDKAGVETTFYSVNGAPFKEGATAAITEDGVNTIEFYSVDKAGNTEAVKTAEVNIDISAPETVSNADGEWHQEFAVVLTATDDKSAVAKTFYSINGSEFAEGNSFTVDQDGINEISFYSVNKAGGKEEVKTAEVKIDRTAPVTESNESADWLKEAVVELTATDDKSGVDKTFYSVNGSEFVGGSTVVITEAGVNEVSYYSIDKVGNKEEVKTIQVNIDSIAPETASNAGSDWYQELMVELTATDKHSGVATTFYSVNGSEFVEGTSFAVTEEGVNTISFYSVDKAGNIEEAKTAEVKIDRTAPETLSNIEDKWLQGEFGVELTATDEHSGVAKTFYSVDGSEFTEGTSFSVSEEGVHDVKFYSTDAAGNKEEVKTAQVKIDKTAPVLSWNLEDEVALGSELAISYEASDALSGIASEKLTVNGEEVANGDLVLFDQPGVYTIQVSVTDQAGWTSTLEETITVFIPLNDFKVMPGVIKGNSGVFSIQVGLPKGFSTKDFDLETVTINGVSAISGKNGFEQQAKQGHFRFNREDFKWNDGTQLLEFRGMVGDYLVVGQATVETKISNKK